MNPRVISGFERRWICLQMGAREHYAVPRVLRHAGALSRLYTDYWHGRRSWRLPGALGRSLAGRYHPELRDADVTDVGMLTVLRSAAGAAAGGDCYRRFLREGRRFARAVRLDLESNRPAGAAPGDVLFAYDTGALEAVVAAGRRGIATIVCQIDPGEVEQRIVHDEHRRWPDWSGAPPAIPSEYNDRRRAEWEAADVVMVNSEWSRRALEEQGVPPEKLAVVPLCYEVPACRPRPSRPAGAPLRVLWFGSVILRKGIQYLIAAAERLDPRDFEFVVAGPIGIRDEVVARCPKHVRFVGRVTRDRASDHYDAADVFVLPTVSDGFAITQLEAMAHGLPVVATENCGRVVTDGVDGFVVPARDSDALADRLRTMASDRDRLLSMSDRARRTAEGFGPHRLAGELAALESRFRSSLETPVPAGGAGKKRSRRH